LLRGERTRRKKKKVLTSSRRCQGGCNKSVVGWKREGGKTSLAPEKAKVFEPVKREGDHRNTKNER